MMDDEARSVTSGRRATTRHATRDDDDDDDDDDDARDERARSRARAPRRTRDARERDGLSARVDERG
jgi:hypothetical protein